jgi:hypothetical protein
LRIFAKKQKWIFVLTLAIICFTCSILQGPKGPLVPRGLGGVGGSADALQLPLAGLIQAKG